MPGAFVEGYEIPVDRLRVVENQEKPRVVILGTWVCVYHGSEVRGVDRTVILKDTDAQIELAEQDRVGQELE